MTRSFSTHRPFRILGIQQVAIGGLDKNVLSKFWVDQLGVPKVGTYKAEVRTGSLLFSFLFSSFLLEREC